MAISVFVFFGVILIHGLAVADKPEGAGKPEWVEEQKVEKEKDKAERKAEKEQDKADRDEDKAERKAEKEKDKADREIEDSTDED